MKIMTLTLLLVGLASIFFGVSQIFGESFEILSPNKQISNGVLSSEIVCKSGFEIIFRPSDGMPACVKTSSFKKLVQRGWSYYYNPIEHLNDQKKRISYASIDKPNIVLILTDDLSVSTLDLLLKNNLMPNLKTYLIDEGTNFNNAFVTAPLCCPSRASILTGLYPHNHEVLFNTPIRIDGKLFAKGGFGSFDDSSTIATWLNQAGYKTGFVGKYFNQYDFKRAGNYIPPGWNDWQALSDNTHWMYDYAINDNGKLVEKIEVYQTDELTERALDFIQESDSPFFLFVSTVAPHGSFPPYGFQCKPDNHRSIIVSPKYQGTLDNIEIPRSPSFNEKDVSDKSPLIRNLKMLENIDCLDSLFRSRGESMLSVDDLIGSIYQSIADKNQINETVFIFLSDNGYFFGEHRIIGKHIPFEESIRIPLIIRVPGYEKQSLDNLVKNNDLAPTIAELAGIEPGIPVDGVSILPILKNSKSTSSNSFLIEVPDTSGGFYHAVRTNDFWYLEYSEFSYSVYNDWKKNPLQQRMWPSIPYGLMPFNFTEFYDLKNDPYQLSNLANCTDDQCIKKIEQLSKLLDELKDCGEGSCQKIENQYIP